IVHLAELALLAVDRRYVDDAAEFSSAHALDHLARHVEQRTEIGVDHGIPLIERHLVERPVLGDSGIVDEDFDRTELGLDLLDARGAGLERADIPFVDGYSGLSLEFLSRRVVAGVARRDLVAGVLQRLADRSANTPRSARHQCNPCHVEFLRGRSYEPERSRPFDTAVQMRMPGARPGITFLSASSEVDR